MDKSLVRLINYQSKHALHIRNVHAFLQSDRARRLSPQNLELLQRQELAMRELDSILKERLRLQGITV